jgi:hypothetical protein
VILRADLDSLTSGSKSLMPEGLEKDINKQDMADLLAYLTVVRTPPKRFVGNTPATVKAMKGEFRLLATNAAIHGGEIAFEGAPFDNIGMWHGQNDHLVWTVEVGKAGEYDVWLDWSCDNAVQGNAWVLEGGKAAVRGKVTGTGGWSRYRQEKVGTISLSAGTQRLTLRPEGAVRGALLDLRGVYLVAPGAKPAAGRYGGRQWLGELSDECEVVRIRPLPDLQPQLRGLLGGILDRDASSLDRDLVSAHGDPIDGVSPVLVDPGTDELAVVEVEGDFAGRQRLAVQRDVSGHLAIGGQRGGGGEQEKGADSEQGQQGGSWREQEGLLEVMAPDGRGGVRSPRAKWFDHE